MVAHLKNTAEPPRIHGWMEIWADGLVFLLFSFCIDVVCEFDFSRFSIRFRLLVFVLPLRTQDICFVTFTTRVSSYSCGESGRVTGTRNQEPRRFQGPGRGLQLTHLTPSSIDNITPTNETVDNRHSTNSKLHGTGRRRPKPVPHQLAALSTTTPVVSGGKEQSLASALLSLSPKPDRQPTVCLGPCLAPCPGGQSTPSPGYPLKQPKLRRAYTSYTSSRGGSAGLYAHANAKDDDTVRTRLQRSTPYPATFSLPPSLTLIPEDTSERPEVSGPDEMAAVNVARPSRQSKATGSWDDLLRNKGQDKAQERAQHVRSRRSQSIDPSFGANGRPNSQARGDFAPVRPRTMMHHAEYRNSQTFSAQVASLNGSPSPLSREVAIESEEETDQTAPRVNHSSNRQQNQQNQQDQPPRHRPGMYARPRRSIHGRNMSGPNSIGTPGLQSFDSMMSNDGRVRANSWAGMPVIDEAMAFQTFPQTNTTFRHSRARWEQLPETNQMHPSRPKPNEQFDRLPSEVLSLILDHLRRLHLPEESDSCATCWMRDCCSVAMCNKGWLDIARKTLYKDIQLVGQDSKQLRKKWDGLYMPRLVLLRRSLRSNIELAQMVRSLKVPALPDDAPIETWEYHDLVASVVMACPNLERVDGFHPSYRYGSESRFFHALASRRSLKEMTWVIEAAPEASVQHHRAQRSSKSRRRYPKSPSTPQTPPQPDDCLVSTLARQFVARHEHWEDLSHLTIHCLRDSILSPPGLINATCSYLPSLKSLYLSQVPARTFNDESLRNLPVALKKLTLSKCVGVTSAGLSTFATRAAASKLETLTLVHQNMDSLPALVRMFAHLSKLTTFSLVQAAAPTMVEDIFMFMPYLASRSLKKLHWDVFEGGVANSNGEGGITRADDILAKSISANGFPRLRSLRVPNDPEGRFQNLCKPNERVDLPGDRLRNGTVNQATTGKVLGNGNGNGSSADVNNTSSATVRRPSSSTQSSGGRGVEVGTAVPDSPNGGRSSSETKDSGKALSLPFREYGSDLYQARLAAQARLEAARRLPRFEAKITDEDGKLLESEGLAGFIGDVRSQICYCLRPDVGGSDERGGLVGIAELLGDGGEDLFGKGDTSSNAGGGFGAGTVPIIVGPGRGRGRGRGEEPAGKGKLTKSNTSGNGKGGSKGDLGEVVKVREGCTGRWNSGVDDGEVVVDKKGVKMERWWHVERGNWRGRVELS